MHIVFVSREYIPSLRGGGIASYIKEMATAYVQKNHQVTIITASDDTRVSSDQIENGIRILRLKGGDFIIPSIEKTSIIKKLRSVYRFHSYRKRIRESILSLQNVDIVEVVDYGAEGLYLQDIKIPVVVRLHTPTLFNRNTIEKNSYPFYQIHKNLPIKAEEKVLKNALYISSCSQSLLQWMYTHIDLSPRKTCVIKNPVSLQSEKVNHTTYKRKDEITIFYAGTIVPTKGVEELFEACKHLNENGKNVRLLMAGKEGAYAQLLRKKINANDKLKWCHLLGTLPREELYSYYISCDLCCFPSWWENMPMVCLEAMACRAIVIGSTSGGMKEIISDKENGFLVPPKKTNELIKCILEIMELDDHQINTIKQAAINTIYKQFDVDIIAKQMLEFYYQIISDNNNLNNPIKT